VTDLAVQNKDEVSLGFLANYISSIYDLPSNRNVSKE
jgi:hypothetical protein